MVVNMQILAHSDLDCVVTVRGSDRLMSRNAGGTRTGFHPKASWFQPNYRERNAG